MSMETHTDESGRDEFDLMLRERSADPQVRALMARLYDLFDGDGYMEQEDGFRWLVVDATRVVDFMAEGKSVLEAMEDSGRWSTDEPCPDYVLRGIESVLSGGPSKQDGRS